MRDHISRFADFLNENIFTSYEQYILNENDINIPDKKEILDLFSQRVKEDSLTKKDLEKIYMLLVKNNDSEKELHDILTQKIGLKDKVAEYLIEEIFKKENASEFFNYVKDNDNKIDVKDFMGKKVNLIDILVSKGLNKKVLEFIQNYEPQQKPNIGKAEVFLALFVKDARRPSAKEHGDLIIANKKFELKGKGARLKGQKGYGEGRSLSLSVQNAVRDVIKKTGIKDFDFEKFPMNKPDNFWNTTGDNWGFEQLAVYFTQLATAQNNKKLKTNHLAYCIASGISGIFTEIDIDKFAQKIEKYLKPDGTITDKKQFNIEYAKLAIEYYCELEGLDEIIAFNEKGEFVCFDKNDFEELIVNKVISISPPGVGPAAGPQGSAFGITLK